MIRNNSVFLFNFEIENKVIVMEKGFPRLNNDEDDVIVRNKNNRKVDSVSYESGWGGDSGASLERIDPFKYTNDKDNWGTCVLVEGGTPGRENSIYTSDTAPDVSMSVSPNPFSPDADGMDDNAVISYFLPFTKGNVKIEIYNSTGRLVRRLFNNEPTGNTRSITWDGRNDEGKTMPIGIYIIFLEALNSDRGIKVFKKGAVVLAGQLE